MKRFASGLSARLRQLAARLVRDQRGVAAVEFAVVVPMMLVMFFGTVEFSNGVAADRKVSMTAQTLADLTSRYTSVTNTDITNFAAFMRLTAPPTPTTSTSSQLNGQTLFSSIGCALCHTPSLPTGSSKSKG